MGSPTLPIIRFIVDINSNPQILPLFSVQKSPSPFTITIRLQVGQPFGYVSNPVTVTRLRIPANYDVGIMANFLRIVWEPKVHVYFILKQNWKTNSPTGTYDHYPMSTEHTRWKRLRLKHINTVTPTDTARRQTTNVRDTVGFVCTRLQKTYDEFQWFFSSRRRLFSPYQQRFFLDFCTWIKTLKTLCNCYPYAFACAFIPTCMPYVCPWI